MRKLPGRVEMFSSNSPRARRQRGTVLAVLAVAGIVTSGIVSVACGTDKKPVTSDIFEPPASGTESNLTDAVGLVDSTNAVCPTGTKYDE